MRTNDARQLDHATLEGVIGVSRSTMYGWLAQYRRGGWGALKAKPLFGRPPKLEWQETEVDLRHGDTKEPVAAQVFVCIVDARDGGEADRRQIQYFA